MSHQRHRGWWVYRPGLEALEGRLLPAQFGVPWHDAKHLSISFVPDGTQIAGHQSDLFKALDAREPTAVWQREVLQAFATWAAQADVNFSLTTDGGQPLGTPGPDQHDPRFGDIRIGAQAMSPGVLSISVPHDPFLSGTWSGDILLNSAVAFDGNGADLFPVLLHEVGHALGLDHSDDPNSVMYSHLDNTKGALAPSDVAAIQALYGPRPDDPFEGTDGNHTLRTAAPVPTPAGYDGSTPLLLYANLSAPGESDDFSLHAPAGYDGPATLRLQTAGVSLLAPRLTVYDAAGRVIADVSSDVATGDTLQVKLPRVDPGATYFVEVRGAAGGVFGVGEYALAASFDAITTVGPDAIDTLARQSYSYLSADDINAIFLDPGGALFHVDHHTDDTFATAAPLSPAGLYGSQAPDRITASLGDPADVDIYRIETPELDDGRPLVMTVTGRATEVNGLMPTVSVFDEDQRPVPAVVLGHGDGTYTIQVADARPNADYFVKVSADPSSGKVVGNYDLDVEYGHDAATPTTFVAATLGGSDPRQSYELVVTQPQLFDLILNAEGETAPAGSGVRMTITDGTGRVVAVRSADLGDAEGGDPLLMVPGYYQVSFAAIGAGDRLPASTSFRLYGASLTDPIGPALDDPTLRPIAIPSQGDPASGHFPAIGSPGDPYTWLALTVFAPKGQNGSPTLLTAQDAVGQGGLLAPRNGPIVLNVLDTTSATQTIPGRVGGAGNSPQPGPAFGLAVSGPAGRPAQLSLLRGLAVAALTGADRPALVERSEDGGVVLDRGGSPYSTDRTVANPVRLAETAQPPAETPRVEQVPGQTGHDPSPPGDPRSPEVRGLQLARQDRTQEASAGSALTPVVVILGASAIAYGYKHRRAVTVGPVSLPFRRANAGRRPQPATRERACLS